MAVCLQCGLSSPTPGVLCSCKKGYTVQDDQKDDPLHILGKLLSNKYVPVALIYTHDSTITYDIVQTIVDRPLTMHVIRPEVLHADGARDYFQKFITKYAAVIQQNIPIMLESFELRELDTIVVTCDAFHGIDMPDLLTSHPLDPVSIMHIIHQILQAGAALHKNGVVFPHLSPKNVRIIPSGSDPYFVRLRGITEAALSSRNETYSIIKNVEDFGQIILSLLTGSPIPVSSPNLPDDRAYLQPTAELFMRAIAPENMRFPSCVELLEAFETAFDLNVHDHENSSPSVSSQLTNKKKTRSHEPIPASQIAWMHRAPHHTILE